MAISTQDEWVLDVIGVDVAPGAAAADGAGSDGSGAGAPAAGGASANGASAGGASADGAAMPAGGAAPDAEAAGGAGAETGATASFAMVGSGHPNVAVPDDAPGADAAGPDADGAEPTGGGDGKADVTGKVIDKVVEIGEKVVVALIDNSGITNSDKRLSVMPQNTPPNKVRDGGTGFARFHFELHGHLFNNTLCDLDIEIDYMVCTVFGNKGRFLKDIRLNVSGRSSVGFKVDVQAVYGDAGNTGPSPEEWVADLVVDINTHWNSGHLFDGKESYRVRLNADTGSKQV